MSTDYGQTWVATGNDVSQSMPSATGIDNAFYRDPATDRLLWVVYGISSNPPQTTMGISDDGGRTWRLGSTPCCDEGENPRMLAAKPRVSITSGYPNVLYYCTNTAQAGGLEFLAGARVCYKSVDGGATWDAGRTLLLKPVGNFLECAGQGEMFDSLDGSYPTADPSGRLYLLIRCGVETENFAGPPPIDSAYIVRSDDEMATWTQVGQPPPLPPGYGTSGIPYKEELRADADGNLYLVRGTGSPTNALYLWVSRDGGATWSGQRQLSIPGTALSDDPMWQLALGSPGRLAVNYAGTQGSSNPCSGATSCSDLNMYLVETDNALDPNVVFRGAALNDPNDHTSYMLGGSDFSDVTIGPDSVFRAAFPGGHIGWLDAVDNCPFVSNPDQLDSGGINTTVPDGIGDACQCGDVTGNGIVNGQDANAIKRHGLRIEPNPTFLVPGNCDVTGNGACNGQDANAVKRAALDLASPLFGQNCHNAIGAPVPPDL
ncbi:MAG: hypothetical protein E6J87_24385 [Deltaproteobacteria bacterium]|nr:MAG: hypothetical protein E6J87_24385 [Deltaproteobacteria bacterium]